MINGVPPATEVEGIGIGKKRFRADRFDLFDYRCDMERIYERVVSPVRRSGP